MLSKSLPEIAGIKIATFKQYAPILIELNKMLNNDERLNSQLNNDAELNTVKQELESVKQELNILQELNTGLNKELQLNNSVKQELDEVKQRLNNQIRLNIELNKEHGLNMPVKQEGVKQGLNIAGWSIQESKGYFRAFKKVGGKMQAVYLGKSLDGAEMKIRAKQERLSVQSEPE